MAALTTGTTSPSTAITTTRCSIPRTNASALPDASITTRWSWLGCGSAPGSPNTSSDREPFNVSGEVTTVPDVLRFKSEGRRFAMLTAYDYTTARLADLAEIP